MRERLTVLILAAEEVIRHALAPEEQRTPGHGQQIALARNQNDAPADYFAFRLRLR
jgi:hypothetical protein